MGQIKLQVPAVYNVVLFVVKRQQERFAVHRFQPKVFRQIL